MSLAIKSTITKEGFAIEVYGPAETEYSMEFFAVGCGGYHASGEVRGKLPEQGRNVHFECTPFPILGVGISYLAVGGDRCTQRLPAQSVGENVPADWSGPFQGRNVPDKQSTTLG